MAYDAVATGQYDVTLAIGAEQTTRGLRIPVTAVGVNINQMMAMAKQGFAIIPGMFALAMRRRMKDYGETVEQFAQVAVKNRKNAHHNPYAHYQDEITIKDVLNSRPICDPVTLFQCCPTSEGAAAAILCSKDVAKRYKTDHFITVASAVLKTPVSFSPALGITTAGLDKLAADEAYNIAGLGASDVDIVELHDPFTASELIHYEDLGLCEIGEGGKILSEGKTEIGGEIPVNTDGGLLSRGHPIGATGLYQIVELVLQLRGQAGQRQVEGAEVGLGHMEGLGPCATVIILKR
jgi:acetyl-CoA acetyltransferase